MADSGEAIYDGADRREIAARTGARSVIIKQTAHSTLDVAHVMAQGGAPSGTLILAEEQTGGRGRQGRAWYSPRGAGIWMTLLLRPRIVPAGGTLAIRAGLAVAETLVTIAPALEPRLKWPNDVMVRDRKVAGVLCEARWSGDALSWVAVGIGINVHGPVPDGVAPVAIAIGDVTPRVGRLAILQGLVPKLLACEASPALLEEGDQVRFMRFAWSPRDETVTGIAPDGALLLRGADGAVERRTDAP